jgi:hypothetical protein
LCQIADVVGFGLIVIEVVAGTNTQPLAGGIVYVTRYVPAALVLGVISPVELLRVNPVVELNIPPVYAFVPVKVTVCATADVQHGEPLYEILAVGKAVMVTDAVAVT